MQAAPNGSVDLDRTRYAIVDADPTTRAGGGVDDVCLALLESQDVLGADHRAATGTLTDVVVDADASSALFAGIGSLVVDFDLSLVEAVKADLVVFDH